MKGMILLPMPTMNMDNSETGCCPAFLPEPWDEKTMVLNGELFIKATTKSVFYMPIDMASVMTRTMTLITEAQAEIQEGYLILSQDISKWKAEHYFLVSKEVPGATMTQLNGEYMTKVFEGAFSEMPKWIKIMEAYVSSQGKVSQGIYAFYTTCPKCAKHFGKNYVVLFSKVQ